jgi:TRAP-type mannitol/chloroaromatic compound transport system permease small subunit
LVRGWVRSIERVSWVCGVLAGLAVIALIGVMMIEVFSRYVLGKPTLWAFDVAYMLNGAAFLLACGLTLRLDQHVRIDIVSQRFSPRVRRVIEVLVFTLLVAPALGFICYSAWGQFWKAWVTGEVEQVSAWRPLMWPFQLVLATGLSALWLQVIARILEPVASEPAAH